MPYDFTTLSPTDFEDLVADLLSASWGSQLEIFKAGKDSGIDLRHSRSLQGDPETIVQCKRFQPFDFNGLKRSMSAERNNLNILQPQRYVIATSVRLSAANKSELLKRVDPWCRGSKDIYGARELNALLRKFPSIERSHFKLWLSSTAMLGQILHAEVFNLTDATIEAVNYQLRKLVLHPGINRALDLLNVHHYAVLIGNPGVGKTTVARLLLAKYVVEGYRPICVTGNVSEAWATLNSAAKTGEKVAILYDDFLGRFSLEDRQFQKNEDHSLLQLLGKVSRNGNLRFLLTTREYLLKEAQRANGPFGDRAQDLVRCMISVGDYTEDVRAQMLFNHLYFSDLPNVRLQAVLKSRAYRAIVRHRHFNPRVVESICNSFTTRDLSDADFIRFIQTEVDDPSNIWKRPFENEISTMARRILALLWSYDGNAEYQALHDGVENMKRGFESFDSFRFEGAIKQIEGSFVQSTRNPNASSGFARLIFRFENPSVEEFLDRWLSKNDSEIRILANAATSMKQISRISNLLSRSDRFSRPNDKDVWLFLRNAAKRCVTERDPMLLGSRGEIYTLAETDSGTVMYGVGNVIEETLNLLTIESHIDLKDDWNNHVQGLIGSVENWEALLAYVLDNEDAASTILSLCEWIKDYKSGLFLCADNAMHCYGKALSLFFEEEDSSTISMDATDTLVSALPVNHRHSQVDRAKLGDAIRKNVSKRLSKVDDADILRQDAEDLAKLERMLNLDFDDEKAECERGAEKIEKYRQKNAFSRPSESVSLGKPQAFDIDRLFAGLLDR